MVILFNKYGNHSNQLFQAIHLEAFCLNNDIKFINCSSSDMERYYTSGASHKWIWMLLKTLHYMKLLKCYEFDECSQQATNEDVIFDNKICLVGGWGFRRHDLTELYRSYFVKKYSIQSKYIQHNVLLHYVDRMKEMGGILVGVHISEPRSLRVTN
jgi:hypothetical protein